MAGSVLNAVGRVSICSAEVYDVNQVGLRLSQLHPAYRLRGTLGLLPE